MNKNLEKKLLAEAFDAYVNEGDLAKAQRLFQRHWNLQAKNQFALLESEDEDFSVTNLGDEFNSEVSDEIGSDADEKSKNLDQAVQELEDNFPVEMTDDVRAKFDELRNKIDEYNNSTEEDGFDCEDCLVVIEDLKGDFEANGGLTDEVNDLFAEIETGIQGGEPTEEINVSDEEIADDDDDVVEEADEKIEDIDIDYESEENDEEPIDAPAEPAKAEDESEDLELVADGQEKLDELQDIFDKLEANESAEEGKEEVNEDWQKAKLPRNGLKSEEEGVKTQSMKFKKPINIDGKVGLGISSADTKGKSAFVKPKVNKIENKGAKSWTKVAKPANTAKDGKSLLGRKN